ncbi:hypothetical protein AK812_SmicGene447 [Symbiodinium microadriaticum]|uniref:Uncharacterized protein n=1 Tax=Symbiodinium microadriaticum TaxID=2951 RepID=A0A1Q9F6T0_SYMMI|nr:hypothetical protein AK812_SmicGene447 [Symbiodinium microadriaticum]
MGHDSCVTLCVDGAACVGEILYGALFKSISGYVSAKMGKSTLVNDVLHELGDHSRPAKEQSVECLVRGDVIREEFRDMELPIGPAIDAATENAKDFIKKCPVFFFGLARQAFLFDLCLEDFLKPCTRGVQVYKRRCGAWTTAGVQEEVLLFDTEGWEFHRQEAASRLLASCMQLAVEAFLFDLCLEDFLKPCTRGVQVYKRRCGAWTTAGVQEEVLLFDTEGWEFHRQEAASRLLASCMQLAVVGNRADSYRTPSISDLSHLESLVQETIQPAVLKHRLVLVVVIDAEHRGDIFDDKFLSLVREVCREAADAGGGVKPVLLPVVSKDDLFRSEQDCQRVCSHFSDELQKKVGLFVDVQDALSVSHEKTDERGMRPSVQQLNNTLARICTEQLKSEPLLAKVKEIIEDDLRRHLQEWEKQGMDSSHALVRRFLWVVAGHRRLRIRNLFEKRPTLLWDGTTGVIARIKRGPGHAMLESTHAWHSDPRRTKSSQSIDSTDVSSSGMAGAASQQSLTDSD